LLNAGYTNADGGVHHVRDTRDTRLPDFWRSLSGGTQ
jgi:hypothetical protein